MIGTHFEACFFPYSSIDNDPTNNIHNHKTQNTKPHKQMKRIWINIKKNEKKSVVDEYCWDVRRGERERLLHDEENGATTETTASTTRILWGNIDVENGRLTLTNHIYIKESEREGERGRGGEGKREKSNLQEHHQQRQRFEVDHLFV